MTHDDELIDRVARAMLDAPICDGTLRGNLEVHFGGEYETMAETAACARMVEQMMRGVSQAAIAAVRAYDAERWQNGGTLDPASLTALAPDVATRETLWPVTEADVAAAQTEIAVAMLADRIRHPAGEELEWARREAATLADRSDPDDYRDLPVAMTGPVEFSGGLTTEKRK